MKISAVIPTKNRPDDLLKAIKSILLQIILPDQLIIIDQSENSQSLNLTNKIGLKDKIDLTYILDPKILGLVHAKHESLKYVRCDLVSFLEDDIVLEKNYFKEKKDAFKQFPNMLGCSGTIINATSESFFYRIFYRLIHVGLFTDRRPDVYYKLNRGILEYSSSNVINGGLSSWKKSVFNEFKFDTLNNFHMLEDFEFSTRVNKKYPKSLFIISKAKLYHYVSPVNRDNINKAVERKTYEYVVFFKKNKKNIYDCFSFLILILGMFLNELIKSFIYINFRIIFSFFNGLNRGYNHKIKLQ
jgi:GT2 family glycosyltransferase